MKIGTVFYDHHGNQELFVNTFGKMQKIPEGYIYHEDEGRLVRATPSYPKPTKGTFNDFSKRTTEVNKTDYYRTDYRSTQTSQNVDTSNVNVDINDRVKFVLSDSNENRSSCIEAAMKAFGMDRTDATRAFDYRRTIVCRPDQFGRFIVYRYETVRGNQIRSLEPKLIPANDPKLYDVSRN